MKMRKKPSNSVKIIAFDFKGRPIGTYDSIKECSRVLNINSTTVYRHLKDGNPLKRNGITFDEV